MYHAQIHLEMRVCPSIHTQAQTNAYTQIHTVIPVFLHSLLFFFVNIIYIIQQHFGEIVLTIVFSKVSGESTKLH